jgi:S-(hydroxymethyl)glutathione dehydrogenase/alcohol dehydrogenase
MKAAVLTHLNAPLSVMEVEPIQQSYDNLCGNGQVLVEVIASGICGSQLQEIQGNKGNAAFLPHMMGHEGVGVVRKTGPGVSVQLEGKRVVMHWRKGAGPEAFQTARYQSGSLTIGGGHVTTLCESAIVSANRLTVVPDDVPDELCALLGCGLSTALGTIEQEAQVKFGESVLIVGCGGVGLNLIQAARLACAFPVVAMDVIDEKQSVCKKLGANVFVNPKSGSEKLREAAGKRGFDVIIDTSGSVEALEMTIPLLSDTGRYVMVGQPKPGQSFKVEGALHMFSGEGKRIMATQGGRFMPSLDIPRYVNLWRSGLLNLDGVVSHRLSLDDINEGIELVVQGQAGRVMVHMR